MMFGKLGKMCRKYLTNCEELICALCRQKSPSVSENQLTQAVLSNSSDYVLCRFYGIYAVMLYNEQ